MAHLTIPAAAAPGGSGNNFALGTRNLGATTLALPLLNNFRTSALAKASTTTIRISATQTTKILDWVTAANLGNVLSPGSYLILALASAPTTDYGVYRIDSLETGLGTTGYGCMCTYVSGVGTNWTVGADYSISVGKGAATENRQFSATGNSQTTSSTSLNALTGAFTGAVTQGTSWMVVLDSDIAHSVAGALVTFEAATFSYSSFTYTAQPQSTRRFTARATPGDFTPIHLEASIISVPVNSGLTLRWSTSSGLVSLGKYRIGFQQMNYTV